jgi:hypothetical protein
LHAEGAAVLGRSAFKRKHGANGSRWREAAGVLAQAAVHEERELDAHDGVGDAKRVLLLVKGFRGQGLEVAGDGVGHLVEPAGAEAVYRHAALHRHLVGKAVRAEKAALQGLPLGQSSHGDQPLNRLCWEKPS